MAISDRRATEEDKKGGSDFIRVTTFLDAQAFENLQMADILRPPEPESVYLREYRDHNLLSLFSEARYLARSPTEKEAILLAITRLEGVVSYCNEAVALREGRLPKTGRFRITLETQRSDFSFKEEFGSRAGESEEDAKARFLNLQVKAAASAHANGRSAFDRSILETFFYWKNRRQLSPTQLKIGPTDDELSKTSAAVTPTAPVITGSAKIFAREIPAVEPSENTPEPVESKNPLVKPFALEVMVWSGKVTRREPITSVPYKHKLFVRRSKGLDGEALWHIDYIYGNTAATASFPGNQSILVQNMVPNGMNESKFNYFKNHVATRADAIPDGSKDDPELIAELKEMAKR